MGRPTLVVPEEARTLRVEHVVLGWKDTREARRALLDALPFLQKATRRGTRRRQETILANRYEISTACLPREHIGDPTAYCGRWNGLGRSDRIGHQIMQAALANIPSQPRRTCIPLFELEPHCSANGSNRILISH